MNGDLTIYTVGHSNHAIDAFIALLRQHNIVAVVDVRSQPYSQWATQFNRELLQHDLDAAGFCYHYLGDVLGGRPSNRELFDSGQEQPNYTRMARDPTYLHGIDRLLGLAATQCSAVMCSEGDYHHCHRHLLITQTLVDKGVRVLHIEPDGGLAEGVLEPQQLSLFD